MQWARALQVSLPGCQNCQHPSYSALLHAGGDQDKCKAGCRECTVNLWTACIAPSMMDASSGWVEAQQRRFPEDVCIAP